MVLATVNKICTFYIEYKDVTLPLVLDEVKVQFYIGDSWVEKSEIEYTLIDDAKVKVTTIFREEADIPLKILYNGIELGSNILIVSKYDLTYIKNLLDSEIQSINALIDKSIDEFTLRKELNKTKDNIVYDTKKIIRR